MRSKEEILQDVGWRVDEPEDALIKVVIELLFDIRDLLNSVDDNVNRMDDRQRGL